MRALPEFKTEELEYLDLDALPPSLRNLIEKIGLTDTHRLCKARGGVRVFVPYKARSDCQLARIVSMDAVRALVKAYQGETLEVPKQDALLRQLRNQAIRAARGEGVSRSVLARRHDLTIRHIQNISREPEEDPSGDLFEQENTA